ncbi:methyltransferase domain-containing protein [Streptomyces sp. SID11385]|uniref:methyltransferase domain-containing protein n=1 Tax=Streptomyces sp. SID11385 TaxID=2706031 RepID=UPI0013CB0462|nr:methyltransferase domain-containing protein [Streptomyces sp. SID11385]NEA42864.1 methyltransferase domain-containing protein [Streptomyces sp. SID11385]
MTDLFERAVPDPAAYLDQLAATDAARSYKGVLFDALDARPGATVLDLGCGSGADLAPLSEAVGPSGKVVGVEIRSELAGRARERTGAAGNVHVVAGDLHALPLPDGCADLARTDRGLQHVADPARALAKARRVLRPGGRLAMGEPDWDSLAIDHPDLGLARAYTRHVADGIVRKGTIGRQLPRLAREAGFAVAAVVPVTSVFREVEAADRVLGLRRTTERAVSAGRLSAADAERWLGHLAAEPFFAAVTLHIVVAELAA